MSLLKYKKKRNFSVTNEPKGTLKDVSSKSIFVVQQHAASHLHYDFRLEVDGVLKSWAVPKGPSLNPSDKRLAMMVEDHPYDYKDFEGEIPQGNYGAGHVIVWDQGEFIWKYTSDKISFDKAFKKGNLKFELFGNKLKGEFALVKLKASNDNSWLLIKHKDDYATEKDILLKNKSVISNKTLKALQNQNNQKKPLVKSKNKQQTILEFISPMLAKSKLEPFDDQEWIFENKYDGYRIICVKNQNKIELFTRNKKLYSDKFPALITTFQSFDHNFIIDGEVIVENKGGKADFQTLQQYLTDKIGKPIFYAFDLLNLNGLSMLDLPLIQRKEILNNLFLNFKSTNLKVAKFIIEKGENLFKKVVKENGEGIIAKKFDSIYEDGIRSSSWLKIKNINTDEAVIIGFSSPAGNRKHIGALILGQYKNNVLSYSGKCGSGFNDFTLKSLYSKLSKIQISKSPVDNVPRLNNITWVKPDFIANIKFTERTKNNSFRHPVFLGLRDDLNIEDINTIKNEEKLNLEVIKRGSTSINITNSNKIYYPNDNITKGEVINYYQKISDYLLPYIKNRPLSLHRFPNGITEEGFYQKDINLKQSPSWIKTAKIHSESNNKFINYFLCNDVASLIYLANTGSIEINPWNSIYKKIENPDWMVIDLDPEKIEFIKVVKVANVIRKMFEVLNIYSLIKTSGATGLHIYIPLSKKYKYEIVKNFAQILASHIQKKIPEFTSIERSPAKRQGKVYIDYLQNRKGQTIAAPYSLRPMKGATVSTPIEWSEVNSKLNIHNFNINTIFKRLDQKGDLWTGVFDKGISIEKSIILIDKYL